MGWHVGECLLLDVLKKLGISRSEYARRVRISRQLAHKIAYNQTEMSIEVLLNSCRVLGCVKEDLYDIKFIPEEGD